MKDLRDLNDWTIHDVTKPQSPKPEAQSPKPETACAGFNPKAEMFDSNKQIYQCVRNLFFETHWLSRVGGVRARPCEDHIGFWVDRARNSPIS